MHCPNCGMAAAPQQKFCRKCGFGLEKVVQLLEESSYTTVEAVSPDSLDERTRLVEKCRDIAFYLFVASAGTGLLAILCYGIIYKMMIVKGNVIPGLLLLLFFLGAIGTVVLQIYVENLKKNQAKVTPQPNNQLTSQNVEAITTSKLLAEARGEQVVSITEDTTKNLQPRV